MINATRKERIDKEYLLNINYEDHLWQEKEIKSVANVTSKNVREFIRIAAQINIKPHVTVYKLDDANQTLIDLKR